MFSKPDFVGDEFVRVVFCTQADGVADAGDDVFYCGAGEGVFDFLLWRGGRCGF